MKCILVLLCAADVVQVNMRESIIIDSWVVRVQYNAFCHALGSGMSIHLQVDRPVIVFRYVIVII